MACLTAEQPLRFAAELPRGEHFQTMRFYTALLNYSNLLYCTWRSAYRPGSRCAPPPISHRASSAKLLNAIYYVILNCSTIKLNSTILYCGALPSSCRRASVMLLNYSTLLLLYD